MTTTVNTIAIIVLAGAALFLAATANSAALEVSIVLGSIQRRLKTICSDNAIVCY